jgi:mannose-1-phosphate guanylyltransferase / mannose-6-phosphate isomerase
VISVNKEKIGVSIIAGGKGTRLWPLSTPAHPKPFVELGAFGSLYGATVQRAAAIGPGALMVLAEAALRPHCPADGAAFVEEPEPRNTAPAVALAGVRTLQALGEDAVAVVLPADHYIPDAPAFAETVLSLAGLCLETGSLGVMGIRPTGPETGYGYLEAGDPVGSGFHLRRFVEKPEREDAQRMLEAGNYSWNSGMFVFPVAILEREIKAHCPGMWEAAEAWVDRGDGDAYRAQPSISVDYALMEKTSKVVMVPASFRWSDVGGFKSLHELLPKDGFGNAGWGPGRVEGCTGCLVITRRPETLVRALDGTAYVETEAGTLVTPLDQAEGIRSGVEAILALRQG